MPIALLLLAALCAKERVPMTFEISTPKPSVVAQEPVLVTFKLHNAGGARALPVDYDSTDVVTLVVLDEHGKVVTQGDGYAEVLRRREPLQRKVQAALETFTLAPGQTMQWERQLSRYLDLAAPGRYTLKARLAFAPQGLALESPGIPLEVRPNRPAALDVLRDQVDPGTAFAVEQHREGGALLTLVHVASPGDPTAFPRSAALPPGDGPGARIAEGDFVRVASHEDELFRWLASVEGGKLRLTPLNQRPVLLDRPFVDGLAPAAAPTLVDLGGAAELLGRPVQHADRSLSVLLRRGAPAASRIELLAFDGQGRAKGGATAVAALPPDPRPAHTAADARGLWLAAAASGGRLPVQLAAIGRDGRSAGRAVLGEADLDALFPGRRGKARWEVRGVQLDVKAWAVTRSALLVALTDAAAEPDAPLVYLVRVPLGERGEPGAPRGVALRLAPAVPSAREPLAAVVPAQDPSRRLRALVTTAAGAVVFVAEESPAREIVRVAPEHAAFPVLYASGRSDYYVLFPEDGVGIGRRLLQRLGK